YRADDAAVLREGVAAQNREEVLDRESGKRYYSFTKVPMRDAAGKVSGLVCIGRDVTDQREAERALARERDLLQTIMDNLPAHIFVKDTQSRFLIANAATLHSLGTSAMSEVVGKTDFDFLPHERARQFYADEQQVIHTGEPMLDREELLIDAR